MLVMLVELLSSPVYMLVMFSAHQYVLRRGGLIDVLLCNHGTHHETLMNDYYLI